MFDFNFSWDDISNFATNFDPVAFEKEVAALANVATVAAVNSPVVVQAPAAVAPAKPEVQKIVTEVVKAAAPVVAPSVPAKVISKLEPIISETIVSSPAVKATPAGETVDTKEVNKIAASVSTAFNKDAQKDAALKADIQKVASAPAPAPEVEPASKTVQKQLDTLNTVVAATVVNSPVVTKTPNGVAPKSVKVQEAVNKVMAAFAPIIAPSVPPKVISKLEPILSDAIVTNPAVKASPTNIAPSTAAVKAIVSTAASTFKTDAQKDDELKTEIKNATTAIDEQSKIQAEKATSTATTAKPATAATTTATTVAVTKPATTATTTAVTTKPPVVTQPGTTATTTAKPDAVNMPFDTTKPATSQTMPFDTTKPTTVANLVTTPTTVVAPATTTAAVKTTTDTTSTTREQRMDELQTAREKKMADEAAARAASNPMFNFQQRPEAKQDEPGFIKYYSWIGGVNSGEWKLYKAPDNPENQQKYLGRTTAGTTMATPGSAVGANAVPVPTAPKTSTVAVTSTPSVTSITPVTSTPTTSSVTSNPTTSAVTSNVTNIVNYNGLDAATATLIQGLQAQITALTANLSKQDAAAAQAQLDATAAAEAAKKQKAENAITVLTDRFSRYGLASLVPKIKELAITGANEDTIALQLQEEEEYKIRFKANEDRIKKGLRVLSPSEYLGLEDDYRQILRAYGLKTFDTDNYVQQFISNDISETELSNRVVTAVQRVQNADPAVLATLRGYYGITDNDLVAYVLDPNQQFQKIERQVAAAEIGAAAGLQGLKAGVTVAEQLAAQGVSKAQAQKGYATIADILPTAEKLSDIYGGTLDEYRQLEAEQEVFNTLASAQRKRRALAEREIATFGGASGLGRTALDQGTRGNF